MTIVRALPLAILRAVWRFRRTIKTDAK